MKGLSGARVLLVDDKQQDAFPIIKAFSKAGIATAYFDGTRGSLPKTKDKLRGVRLAILDIELGFHGGDKTKAATLVQTLSRIIARDNGPYGVLLWTKHPEDKDEVAKYIFTSQDLPNPVFVEMLTKSDYTTKARGGGPAKGFQVDKLAEALSTRLSENSPLECLQVWEGSCFEAATRVINSIGDHSTKDAGQLEEWRNGWQKETLKLLFAIGHAKAEKHHSTKNCIPSMFLALNPLHTDRMDLLVEDVSAPLTKYAEQIMNAKGGSAIERRARVNSMLHLGSDHLRKFEPGNLYVFAGGDTPKLMPTLAELLVGVIGEDSPNYEEVTESAYRLALEVTPMCDYAQDKMGNSRLCAGFALPSTLDKRAKAKNPQFLKSLGPFQLSSSLLPAGIYTLHFNSQYLVSCKVSKVKKLKPTARARPQLLASVQSWLAYQSSRQGIILLS